MGVIFKPPSWPLERGGSHLWEDLVSLVPYWEGGDFSRDLVTRRQLTVDGSTDGLAWGVRGVGRVRTWDPSVGDDGGDQIVGLPQISTFAAGVTLLLAFYADNNFGGSQELVNGWADVFTLRMNHARSDGGIAFITNRGGFATLQSSGNSFDESKFHVLIARFDEGLNEKRFWVDGVDQGNATHGTAWSGSGTTLNIGVHDNGFSSPFEGSVAMFAVWSRPLDFEQIMELTRDPFVLLRPARRIVYRHPPREFVTGGVRRTYE